MTKYLQISRFRQMSRFRQNAQISTIVSFSPCSTVSLDCMQCCRADDPLCSHRLFSRVLPLQTLKPLYTIEYRSRNFDNKRRRRHSPPDDVGISTGSTPICLLRQATSSVGNLSFPVRATSRFLALQPLETSFVSKAPTGRTMTSQQPWPGKSHSTFPTATESPVWQTSCACTTSCDAPSLKTHLHEDASDRLCLLQTCCSGIV